MLLQRIFFAALFATASIFTSSAQPVNTQPLPQLTLADPTVFYWQGKYYAFGTSGSNSNNGIPVYESGDLMHWKPIITNDGFALKKGDGFGTKGFWAPQVFYQDNLFYLAYTANENIAIATSSNPYGPFMQPNKVALPASVKQIDPFIFIDDDGKKYLYHVRLTNGNRIFGAELKNDFSGVVDSTLVECIAASDHWENTGDSSWPVTEGPTVLKRGKKYYMFYSANDFRNPNYAVGMATSKHPLGPWVKFKGNPVLSSKQTGQNGTGHGDFFKAADGKWFYIFHAHQSSEKVAPRKTMLLQAAFSKRGMKFHQPVLVPLISDKEQ
ncbi:MAG: glycoside hydrolase family 43 protein [Bacteroidota bacterium]